MRRARYASSHPRRGWHPLNADGNDLAKRIAFRRRSLRGEIIRPPTSTKAPRRWGSQALRTRRTGSKGHRRPEPPSFQPPEPRVVAEPSGPGATTPGTRTHPHTLFGHRGDLIQSSDHVRPCPLRLVSRARRGRARENVPGCGGSCPYCHTRHGADDLRCEGAARARSPSRAQNRTPEAQCGGWPPPRGRRVRAGPRCSGRGYERGWRMRAGGPPRSGCVRSGPGAGSAGSGPTGAPGRGTVCDEPVPGSAASPPARGAVPAPACALRCANSCQ